MDGILRNSRNSWCEYSWIRSDFPTLQLYQTTKKPIQPANWVNPEKRALISKSEPNLGDLLKEIEFFIQKWRKSTFLKVCYRREIEMKSMWQNRGKIREHSREIRQRIRPLRRLQGSKPTLDSLENIINRMVDLGLEVESTFETTKTINEALQTEPNRINRLMYEGDRICEDLTNIVSQLEKLR